MKSVFRVKKVKNNYTMSIEDSMNLNSQMIKKEKDFLQFIRQKLDPKKKSYPSPSDNPGKPFSPLPLYWLRLQCRKTPVRYSAKGIF
jgi:hypothetical protein